MRSKLASRHPFLLLLAVALVSVLFVVACGDGDPEPTTAPVDTGAAEAAAAVEAAEAAVSEAEATLSEAAMAAEDAAKAAEEAVAFAAELAAAAQAAAEAAGTADSAAVKAAQDAAAEAVAAAEAAAAQAAELAMAAAEAQAAAAEAAELAAAAAAAEAAAQAGGPKYGGTLTFAQHQATGTLDPATSLGGVEYIVMLAVYDNLLMIQPDLTVKPELATSWEANDDFSSYTFYLREGVKFRHGKEFKAEDVVFTINRLLDPELDSRARPIFEVIQDMVVLDDYTIRFDLEGPNGFFLDILSEPLAHILPADVDVERLAQEEFGTGPFMIEERLPGERTTLVRNPDYWEEGKPYLDEIVIQAIPEAAARVEALKSGDVDIIWQVNPQSVPSIAANPETTVLNAASFSHLALCIPTNVPPYDNKLVRKAMQAATDREGINQAVLLGLGIPARDHPIHPSHPTFASQYAPPDYDPELARSLLEQAGYPDGIDLTLYTSDIGPGLIELAVAYQESAAPAGIRIDVERAPSEVYWSQVWNTGKLASVYWFGFMPDQALLRQIHSEAAFNCPRYSNPLVDELIEKARGQDLEGQKESYGEIQRILIDDVPRLIVVFQPWIYGVNKDLRGVAPHPRGFAIIQDAWFDR